MSVDQYGRPWFGLSHNGADIGIFATIIEGPTLRGAYGPLKVMPSGGAETLQHNYSKCFTYAMLWAEPQIGILYV